MFFINRKTTYDIDDDLIDSNINALKSPQSRRYKKLENIVEQIEKDYEAMGKTIKNLTFSYMDKQGELWDDKKRMEENLITKLDDTSWQKEFLEMKSHSTSDVRLLMQGAKGFRDAWHLGSLHEEYKIMKRREHQQQQ